MEGGDARGLGWQRDLKDGRDYHPSTPLVQGLLQRLGRPRSRSHRLPPGVDLREYLGPVPDQGRLDSSPAFAALGLVGYFEARTLGRAFDGSPLFLHQTALRLLRRAEGGVDLRTTFKALRRFGAPPAAFWPYRDRPPPPAPRDGFLYAFAGDVEDLRYFRLDAPTGEGTLRAVKSFLDAGFVVAFGFPVPVALGDEADVAYRPDRDAIRGGQAVLAVGYDDRRRVGCETGAVLFRNSWGPTWGEVGYGWLPYPYVTTAAAADFWTAARPPWVEAGILTRPRPDPD
jgi:C1A family cysteine protease